MISENTRWFGWLVSALLLYHSNIGYSMSFNDIINSLHALKYWRSGQNIKWIWFLSVSQLFNPKVWS